MGASFCSSFSLLSGPVFWRVAIGVPSEVCDTRAGAASAPDNILNHGSHVIHHHCGHLTHVRRIKLRMILASARPPVEESPRVFGHRHPAQNGNGAGRQRGRVLSQNNLVTKVSRTYAVPHACSFCCETSHASSNQRKPCSKKKHFKHQLNKQY